MQFKAIVLGLDGSELSDRAIPVAQELAQRDGGHIEVVHVRELMVGRAGGYPVNPDEDEREAKVRRQVEALNSAGTKAVLHSSRRHQRPGPRNRGGRRGCPRRPHRRRDARPCAGGRPAARQRDAAAPAHLAVPGARRAAAAQRNGAGKERHERHHGSQFGVAGIDGDLAERLREETARHWKLLLAIGILCDIVGVYSILVPIVASISVTVLVGWALVVGGIVQLVHALKARPVVVVGRRLAHPRIRAHDRRGCVDLARPPDRDDHADGCAGRLVLGDRRPAADGLVELAPGRGQLDRRVNGAARWYSASSSGPNCRARRRGRSACSSASSCSSRAPG